MEIPEESTVSPPPRTLTPPPALGEDVEEQAKEWLGTTPGVSPGTALYSLARALIDDDPRHSWKILQYRLDTERCQEKFYYRMQPRFL